MVDVESYESLVEELALLRDVHRGLADVEAGRRCLTASLANKLDVDCSIKAQGPHPGTRQRPIPERGPLARPSGRHGGLPLRRNAPRVGRGTSD